MKKISIKGVLIGAIVDIVSTNILMIPLIIYVLVSNDFINLPKVDMLKTLQAFMKTDQMVHIVQILLGSLASILGGYIAAKIAKHDALLNGALSSIFCVMFGLYAFTIGSFEDNYIKHILILLSSPILGLIGGYFYSRK
jgi:hypothetical protein